MDLLRRHRGARQIEHAVGLRQDRLVVVRELAGLRQHAGILLGDHRQRALRQIAEVVGEIGIGAVYDGLVVVAAVLAERYFAQQEIAQLIDAVLHREIEGIDDVADRLRHLLALVEQEAVGIDALRQRDARRHQERRPVHRVEADDVLADDVRVRRPVAPVGVALVRIADARNVVGQRVDPDIHHVLRIAGHLDAPVEGGARDREILEAALDEAHHLVAAGVRADKVRLLLVELQELVLIGGELEEVAGLLDPLDRRALRSAAYLVLADDGLVLGVIGLVAHRVPAGVRVEIDVAIVRHALPDRLAGAMVFFFRGADEAVVANVEDAVHVLELRGVARRQIGRRQAFLRRGLHHLLAVLVGAGEKEHVLAIEPLEARQGIGRDRLIGVADMRYAVGIGDRGRDVIGAAGIVRRIRHDCEGLSSHVKTAPQRHADVSAQLPREARTPRKPAVFARDCRIRSRARHD